MTAMFRRFGRDAPVMRPRGLFPARHGRLRLRDPGPGPGRMFLPLFTAVGFGLRRGQRLPARQPELYILYVLATLVSFWPSPWGSSHDARPVRVLPWWPPGRGVVNRVKALFGGRRASPGATYRDILKCLGKGATISRTHLALRAGPAANLAATPGPFCSCPWATCRPRSPFPETSSSSPTFWPWAASSPSWPPGHGSSFEGMGASREAVFFLPGRAHAVSGPLALARYSDNLSFRACSRPCPRDRGSRRAGPGHWSPCRFPAAFVRELPGALRRPQHPPGADHDPRGHGPGSRRPGPGFIHTPRPSSCGFSRPNRKPVLPAASGSLPWTRSGGLAGFSGRRGRGRDRIDHGPAALTRVPPLLAAAGPSPPWPSSGGELGRCRLRDMESLRRPKGLALWNPWRMPRRADFSPGIGLAREGIGHGRAPWPTRRWCRSS